MSWLSQAWRRFRARSIAPRSLPLRANLICQQPNGDGTVDCRLALSDGSAEYTLVVPVSSDGYYELVRRDGAFNHLIELMCLICKRGDTVFDFGANIGTVSIPLAARDCKVYAFEILPGNVDLLLRSAARNPGIPLEVLRQAIWQCDAVLQAAGHSAWGRIVPAGNIEVPAVSLDNFVRTHGVSAVHLIKIDVEGSELSAFKGMHGVLTKFKPDIVFEANVLTCGVNGHSIYDLFGFLESLNYCLYRIDDRLLVPFCRRDTQFVICTDYLATFRPPSSLEGISYRVGPASAGSLMTLMRSHGTVAREHRKYMALHRKALPRELQSDPDFAALLKTWSDEPADDQLMLFLRAGCQNLRNGA